MPRISKAEELSQIHRDALREFDEIQSAQRFERQQALEDRRFCSEPGQQWAGPLGEQFANKPRFEFNKVHLAVLRIENEFRANRTTVDFQPRDGAEDDGLADVLDGLYRADEKRCTADEAYDNAFDDAVKGGMGAWRLRAEYEDDEDEDDDRQTIRMEPIFDADTTVFFDLDAKRQDKADAKRCYVLTPYTHAAFEAEFGESPTTWPKEITAEYQFEWVTHDYVWVCEHYRAEEVTEDVRWYRGMIEGEPDVKVTPSDLEADPAMIQELLATGFQLVRQKRVTRRKIRKLVLSGARVERDDGHIAGSCIPVVPTYGKRWVTEGVEHFMGHVRLAKDAQRLTNLLMSWLAEISARHDVSKPILTPQQIAAHAHMWSRDNVDKYPYLLIDPLIDPTTGQMVANAPIGYTKSPEIPAPMAALTQLAGQALEDLLGNQQAGEEVKPNISGKVLELVQTRLDMQTAIYMDNFRKAMKRCGEIWLSMKRDITVERERRAKTLSTTGETGSTVLNQPAIDPKTGARYIKHDVTRARYEVDVEVGPSSSSRRAATVRSLIGVLQMVQDPETQQVLTSNILMNLEGEGMGEVRDYYRRRLLRMGAIKPNEKEAKELAAEQANQQPDPQSLYLMREAEKAEALAVKARADTVETLASADLKAAQTVKTQAETDGARVDQAVNVADALQRVAQPFGGSTPPTIQSP